MMGKVDCVMGACNESFEKGAEYSSIKIAENLLVNSNLSLAEIAENTDLPLKKVEELESDI